MAETTADVRRDIELTRERMTSTLAELEQKLHLTRIVRDNPWPAIGVAFGAGLLLSGSRADVKAAAATATATRGASNKLAPALDDIVANLMQGLGAALQHHVDTLLDEVKQAIGAPTGGPSAFAQQGHQGHQPSGGRMGFAGGPGMTDASNSATHTHADGTTHAHPHQGAHEHQAGAGLGGSASSDTWSPHTAGVSASAGGATNLTPSTAGSQGLRAD
jgi:hypothetical protein